MNSLPDFCNKLSISSNNRLKLVITKNTGLIIILLKKIYSLGFLQKYKVLNFKYIKVFFKLIHGDPVLRGIYCISKASLKLYLKRKHLQRNTIIHKSNSSGFVFLSTNKGILTDTECALNGIGGKALVAIY